MNRIDEIIEHKEELIKDIIKQIIQEIFDDLEEYEIDERDMVCEKTIMEMGKYNDFKRWIRKKGVKDKEISCYARWYLIQLIRKKWLGDLNEDEIIRMGKF